MWEEIEKDNIQSGLLTPDLPILTSITDHEKVIEFPYSILLTQACDLKSYFRIIQSGSPNGLQDRQRIEQVIFCPVFIEEQFKKGSHLIKQYNYSFKVIEKQIYNDIKKNNTSRYYFIESNIKALPNLIVDFKHYFTIPIVVMLQALELNRGNLYKLRHIYYTDLADRFAHYLQRVVLP